MILKGSQRANGADLAIHLMNSFDNESVEIAEVYGTVAGDLMGAFEEMEVVAQGTRADNYLYSLSINPSAPLTREQYYDCIQTIEERLGLADQPRAVVFHVKDGREHCHVVWSKIDAAEMKAIHMAYDHEKLMDLSCELARKHGCELPPGLKAWEAKRKFEKDYLDATQAENAQAQETGISQDERRAEITGAYEQSDNAVAFINALEAKGYVLAQGDRRGFVVVDRFANVHSLTRYIKGHTAKAIKAKLAPLTPEDLPTVDQAKEMVRQRQQAQKDIEQDRRRESEKQDHLEDFRNAQEDALGRKQQQRRAELRKEEQELLIRQAAEKLALHAAQKAESSGLMFRVRSAVADLIRRTPGLRSVLGPLQKLTHLDPQERHKLERKALERRHAREKKGITRQKRLLKRVETRESQALEKALKKAAAQARQLEGRAKQKFHEAAKGHQMRGRTDFGEGELREEFNDAAEFVEGSDRAGEDDEGIESSWEDRAERLQSGRKPKRGKGMRYRRDDE